jgi:hypothetical protein
MATTTAPSGRRWIVRTNGPRGGDRKLGTRNDNRRASADTTCTDSANATVDGWRIGGSNLALRSDLVMSGV